MMMRSPSDYGMHNEVDPSTGCVAIWGVDGPTDDVADFAHVNSRKDRPLFGQICFHAIAPAAAGVNCM